jgi:hypothetical protein
LAEQLFFRRTMRNPMIMQSQVPCQFCLRSYTCQFCLRSYKCFRIGAYDPQLSTLIVDVLNGIVRETPGAGLNDERWRIGRLFVTKVAMIRKRSPRVCAQE